MLKATWSDSKAVRDYQDFLSSGKQEMDLAKDCPSVIVVPRGTVTGSAPELAEALYQMSQGQDIVLTPDQPLPSSIGDSQEYPVYVTLPPFLLDDFLQNLSESYRERSEDFVFFSGGLKYGNIEDLLKERGYCRDSMTQVLVSGMRIPPSRKPQDLHVNLGADASGEDKIAGSCSSCGKWAGAIAERLERNEVLCQVDFYREWRRKMWERSVFDAVFHVVGAVRSEPTSLADTANFYADEVSDIAWEMSQLLRGWKAVTLMFGFEERMFGIAESKTDSPCTLVDCMYPYVWGNFVFLENRAFVEYLTIAQENGLLQSVQLPSRSDDSYTSKMRQGNLRADGAV